LTYAAKIGCCEVVLRDDVEDIVHLRGGVDLGLFAVENSLEGSIGSTLDLLKEMETLIRDELILQIRHFLLSKAPSISSVGRVLSHPAALAQCRRFIKDHLSGRQIMSTSSTAEGARLASRDPGCAAIASLRAASIYGLGVLAEDIQDQDSYTRFLVVGREPTSPTGRDKTSLIFAVRDEPGALYKALRPFAERGINLKKIESRPSRRVLGEYMFFVDVEGHTQDSGLSEALQELRDVCTTVKILGSYPMATVPTPPSRG